MDINQPSPEIPSRPSSPSPQQSKPHFIFLFAGIILLVIGFTGGIFVGKNLSSLTNNPPPVSPNISKTPSSLLSPSPTLTSSPTANWKTYTSKDDYFKISYPPNWTVNDTNGIDFVSNNETQVSILTHKKGDKEYVENLWKSVGCRNGNETSGCAPDQNKETSSYTLNNNTIFFKITGNNQLYAFIPNQEKDITIQIYSIGLKNNKTLFNRILSTFKFLDNVNADQCGITSCHGLDITCGSNVPKACTEIFMLGDNCRQYAKCQITDGTCQQVKSSAFDTCKSCIEKCQKDFKGNGINVIECGSKCSET